MDLHSYEKSIGIGIGKCGQKKHQDKHEDCKQEGGRGRGKT
jgi:hypothetical protein